MHLKRIIAGKFTGRERGDRLVCEKNSGDIWLRHTHSSLWESILTGCDANAMAVLEFGDIIKILSVDYQALNVSRIVSKKFRTSAGNQNGV